MKAAIVALVLLSAVLVFAQQADLHDRIAFVSLTTVKAAQPGTPDAFAPNVLLRFVKRGGSSTIFAMTDKYGVAVIPIEGGTYCATAYGLDGRVVALAARSSEKQHRCFEAVPGKMIEFSVTLAPNANYGGDVPSLGVE